MKNTQETLRQLNFSFMDIKENFNELKVRVEKNNSESIDCVKSIIKIFKTQQELSNGINEMNKEIFEIIKTHKEQLETINQVLMNFAKENEKTRIEK